MRRLSVCVLLMLAGNLVAADAKPKNVILFIGDGMGVSQLSAARVLVGRLQVEDFAVVGLMATHAHDQFVTDSAAAGTALATGVKTYNGAISVGPDKQPRKTVLEWAEESGRSTGLVSTCSLTHATPAAFAAHVDSRKKDAEIAADIAASGVDVLFGGGWAYFAPASAEGSKRKDDADPLAALAARMPVVRTAEEFAALGTVDAAAGFFADKHPGKAAERQPDLATLTAKALAILARDADGFFLMVEGSQIDWAGHNNDLDYLSGELRDFDAAVGVGMDFARERDDTLVIVTADHETGGFALHKGDVADNTVGEAGWTSKKHTAALVPVFAHGPGSAVFAGIYENTDIGKRLIAYMQ